MTKLAAISDDVSLSDELNAFYPHFEHIPPRNIPLPPPPLPCWLPSIHLSSRCQICFHEGKHLVSSRSWRSPWAGSEIVCQSTGQSLLSIRQSTVPICSWENFINIVRKKCKVTRLNDPAALALTVMQCFERLVMGYICSSLMDNLDLLSFVNRVKGLQRSPLHYIQLRITLTMQTPMHSLTTALPSTP